MYEITLLAIDIDNIGCLEPFLPLSDHFENRRFLGLQCRVDLTPRHKQFPCLVLSTLVCSEKKIAELDKKTCSINFPSSPDKDMAKVGRCAGMRFRENRIDTFPFSKS